MKNKQYTQYDDVNVILELLLASAKDILKEQFIGMYLYGSLSSGDFNPETSDIDFLVVTSDLLSDKTVSELEAMHNKTWATSLKRAGKLEGAYVPKELIRRHNPNGAACPTINEGKFYLDRPGSDWVIQRHVIREYGVVLEGPDPKTLIDFVTPDDIRGAVMGTLHEWWFPMLDDPSWLRNHEDGDRAFAVITMCRVLHALEHGTIVSKPKAIQWARNKLGNLWNALLDKAVAVSEHKEQGITLNETLDFIRFTMEFINKEVCIITYREYQDSDWTAICQIHDRARPDELVGSCDPRGFIPIEQDKEVEDLKRSHKFVACIDEQVVGFVGVDDDYLAWLYIDPNHYRKGIGRELLRIGIRKIGEGAWTIALDGNHKAISLYESEGFREVKRFAGDNNGYPCMCLRMEREKSA